MTTVAISQPMLFPWPGFFEMYALSDIFVHLEDVQFSKGSFTNRIQIKHHDTRKWMTIPLVDKGAFQSIKNLRSTGEGWKSAHRSLIRNALVDAPYVEDALSLLDLVYCESNLSKLLIKSIELSASYMKVGNETEVVNAADLGVEGKSWRRVLDIVLKLGGTRYITGHGAVHYLDHMAFEEAGVSVEYLDYSLTPWPQGPHAFIAYVSVLDLIAHVGEEAAHYIKPRTLPWRKFVGDRNTG